MFDRHAKLALVLVSATLILCGLGFRSAVQKLNVHLRKEPVAPRSHFDNIATRLPTWESVGESTRLSAEMMKELGTELYLDRQYVRRDDAEARLNVHIAYYTGMIDAVPHVPDRCLVAGGFNARTTPVNYPLELRPMELSRVPGAPEPADGTSMGEVVTYPDPATGAAVTVRMPRGRFALRTTEFSHKNSPDARVFAGYFFVANGRVAVTPEDVKVIAFRKSEKYAYYCKVQIAAAGDKTLTAETFIERAADLFGEFVPELMRCLPDWSLVEAQQVAEAAGADR